MTQFFFEYEGIAIFLSFLLLVIPTEIILGLSGYLIAKGEIGFGLAFIAALSGGVLSQFILFFISRMFGQSIVFLLCKLLFIPTNRFKQFESWFQEYGGIVLIFARLLPGFRSLASITAGVVNIHYSIFIWYTTIALAPVSIVLLLIGIELGENWIHIESYIAPYLPFIALLILFFITFFTLLKRKQKKKALLKEKL